MFEREKTVYALDRAATVIGNQIHSCQILINNGRSIRLFFSKYLATFTCDVTKQRKYIYPERIMISFAGKSIE
jgi:hypothetical protein